MSDVINWLTTTQLGLATVLGSLFLLFILVAVIYEMRTRRLFPDANRRGKKAQREDGEGEDDES